MAERLEGSGFWSRIFNSIHRTSEESLVSKKIDSEIKSANYSGGSANYSVGSAVYSPWRAVNTKSFDGEKTAGTMGAPINLIPEHSGLRYRAHEAQLKSDVVKMITGKFFKWVIGNGLKLNVEPDESILRDLGIADDLTYFRRITESRFRIYSESKMSDFSNMSNLHRRADEAFRTAFLSGDALVILRVENGSLTTQVIDGSEVCSPVFDSKYYDDAKKNGNKIVHGIEINDRGEHIAFFVKTNKGSILGGLDRVSARGEESGRLMAWMIYGDKHRINHHRGIPRIAAILEKVEKLDRYTEASVAGAEERAKIVFSIEHSRDSSGENPLVQQMRKNMGSSMDSGNPHSEGESLGKNISRTTNKQTFNMPIGAKLSTLASSQENQYDEFFNAVFVQLCAAVDIPPEVALQKYSSNYSASRAAINGWGYIIDIYRKGFEFDFYKNVYRAWLEVEVLKGNIKAPGLMKAIMSNDEFLIESYCKSKFTGVNMPHIDPLKEVKAVRSMLGNPLTNEIPLISHERAAEVLNLGEWSENYLKFKEETKDIPVVHPSDLTEKEVEEEDEEEDLE
jgi:hypothetical protein